MRRAGRRAGRQVERGKGRRRRTEDELAREELGRAREQTAGLQYELRDAWAEVEALWRALDAAAAEAAPVAGGGLPEWLGGAGV